MPPQGLLCKRRHSFPPAPAVSEPESKGDHEKAEKLASQSVLPLLPAPLLIGVAGISLYFVPEGLKTVSCITNLELSGGWPAWVVVGSFLLGVDRGE